MAISANLGAPFHPKTQIPNMSNIPTTSVANMQNLMIQLGAAVPNTVIVGSAIDDCVNQKPKARRAKVKKAVRG